MFGFLFKRKKSIDSKDKEKNPNKNLTNDNCGSASSASPLQTSNVSASQSQSNLARNIVSADDNDSIRTSPHDPTTTDNRYVDLKDRNIKFHGLGESEPSLNSNSKYFSLTDLSKGIDFIDEPDPKSSDELKSGNVDAKCAEFVEAFKRDLSEAERNAMVELDEVRSKILAKDTEISLLHADVNMLSVDRDNKIVEIEDLTCQLRRIQEENETSLATVQSIETELAALREKNNELTAELLRKSENLSRVEESTFSGEKALKDFQVRVKCLEKKVKDLEVERDRLTEEHEAIEVEREEEMRAIQNALDDALEEKIKLQNKFERDFEVLRSTCSSQESQLMDDFEWKLRQIESTCKKKVQDKDRQMEEKLKEVRTEVSKDIIEEREKMKEEKVLVEEQMRQVSHFKSYEVELIQLRGLTHEQQKCMRSASRQIEHLKFTEKLARDDLRTIRTLLEKEKANLQVTQTNHQRRLEVQEENVHVQLGKQRLELNAKFEDRMRTECSRLKQDLAKHHVEEKHLAVESMRLHKDQELSSLKQGFERQKQELAQEISKLKDTITEKESWAHRELDKLRTQADRDNWELRRKMEKENSSHAELIAELTEAHKDELDSLREQYEIVAERLREVEKKLLEAEDKHRKLANYEMTNGKLSPGPHANPVNKSDSGCGDDVSEEEDEDEDDGDADEEDDSEEGDEHDNHVIVPLHKKKSPVEIPEDSSSCSSEHAEETVVHSLREEVANLQGSIEKLTSTLTTEESVSCETPPKTKSDRSSSSEEEIPSASDGLSVPSFVLICAAPLASFMLFQSILVLLWTFLVLIAFRISQLEL